MELGIRIAGLLISRRGFPTGGILRILAGAKAYVGLDSTSGAAEAERGREGSIDFLEKQKE